VPALNPDIAVYVSVTPAGTALRGELEQLTEASGLTFLPEGLDPAGLGAPVIHILDRSADPTAALPRGTGPLPQPGDAILVSSQPDPAFFDTVAAEALALRLPFVLGTLARQAQLAHQVRQEEEAVTILNEIGLALSAIPERDALLHAVLFQTRRVVKADGGSLYLVAGDRLIFGAAQNDTVEFEPAAHSLAIDDSSLAGYVAARGIVQVIDDAYQLPPDAPYSFNTGFDQRSGYCSRTMLTVPMRDRQGRVIAVVSLINRKPQFGVPLESFDDVEPFSRRDVALVRSIAAQAAVALENHRLYEDIRRLFDGFVEAAVTGIEARDPATGGHSHRVAALTVALARAVNANRSPTFAGTHFTQEDLTELHYAALLHDFGKVGVREEVLLKAEKLFPWELDVLESRFRLYATQVRYGAIEVEELSARLDEIKEAVAALRTMNRPGTRMEGQTAVLLKRAASEWRLADDGTTVIRERDMERLSMLKGSLSDDERAEINAHVEHTRQFLERIPWTPNLQGIPDLAVAHHERLDGSGYPRGLRGDDIPMGAKLMAICDVFDALTAGDRPYRSAMSVERGLWILQLEAKDGKLLPEAVQLFIDERIWAGVTPGA
jgi:HD-GYP domain-containing protein (c-di-GMP phosphodiesterase class II)